MIDYERFRSTPLVREPFDHLVVPEFLDPGLVDPVLSGFPRIEKGGSFPLSVLACGSGFDGLVEELRGAELRKAVAEKFGIDLEGRPALVTVRGQARPKDGRIHTDTETKLVTVLLYLNRGWKDKGGWLRLLRSNASLDDYFTEVPPEAGTAVFFRCTKNAWHGHTPYVGERRALQLNWVTDESIVRHEERRHRFSARLKKWLPA
jgi:SM-20-related protein